MEPQLDLIEHSFDEHYSNWVYEALDELSDNFTITDPCISGHPIVFASRGCLRMFGYGKEEVVGRNGRMFQGNLTCRRTVMQIREAIREERSIEVSLLNYRKDGTPFWMLFCMSPVFSEEDGKVINFVSVQVPILRTPRHCRGERVPIRSEVLHGSCRKEACLDSTMESNHFPGLDSEFETENGVEIEEMCGASEPEKQKATTATNNILSVLTQYGALRRKSVSGRRCSVEKTGLHNSALLTSLGRIKQSFVLIDPHLPSMPIVYASEAFLNLTGYDRHEVLGRSHRFLSGSDVNSSFLLQINECIQNGKPCQVRVLHYRKDMTSFWNHLHISPIRNASGKIAYFIEVHVEEDQDDQKLETDVRQLGVIAMAKVAVRSATMGPRSS